MTPKDVALALGRRVLDEVVLPSGSRPLTTPEPAALGGFVPQPGVENLLFAHRLFTVNESLHAVCQWLQAHMPQGFASGGTSIGTMGGVQTCWLTDDLSVLPANISVAELVFRIAADASGGVVVRVDSEVAWTARRPADEFVPPRDHVMILETIHAYEPGKPVGKHLIVTDAHLVRPIVSAFNSVRVEPPTGTLGFRECGYIGLHDIVYQIAFATTTTATPDVVATLSCAEIAVMVNGEPAPPLQTLSAQAWNDMTHDLGIAEPYPQLNHSRR